MTRRLYISTVLLTWATLSMLGTVTVAFARNAANNNNRVVTLNENRPKGTISVAPGTEIRVVLVSKARFGYHWDVSFVKSMCGGHELMTNENANCFGRPPKPVQGDWPGQFVEVIKAPNVKSEVEISYACFPPYKESDPKTHEAELVYDLTVVVK